ncbi:MAG TPA: hypothetical protein VM056_02055 [Terriglobales bacterium]|nr:hypothetical protein [Terriglobales bacterium]
MQGNLLRYRGLSAGGGDPRLLQVVVRQSGPQCLAWKYTSTKSDAVKDGSRWVLGT